MTFAFAFYLWWKHLQGVYGTTRQSLAFFGLLTLAVIVDGSGWLELLGRVVVAVGPIAWRQLMG